MIGEAKEIQSLALKYSKPQLAHMAQMGLIDTQKAVLAAMMRDRIAKEDAKPPTTTVAQDVMGVQPQMAQIAPTSPEQPMGMPAAPAPVAPEQMAATGGLTSIPVKEQDYAGGGIVAFADGGDTGYEYQFNPDTGEYTLIGEKKKEVPVDTRQHLGAAGLGVFGSEGMDLMTGLPKGSMSDPVLGFAGGGMPSYAGGPYYGSLVTEPTRVAGRGFMAPDPAAIQQQLDIIESQIAQTPAGRGRAGLENQRNELRAQLGSSLPSAQIAPTYSEIVPESNIGSQTFAPQLPAFKDARTAPPAADKNTAAPPAPPRVGAPKMGGINTLPDIGRYKMAAIEEQAKPESETIKQALSFQEEADKAAGVDTGIFEKLRGEYEGKKGKVNERKQEAIGMAIMQTGLGMMGATKGRELAALGESGQKALAGLVSTNEKIRDYEDKLEDKQRELLLAQNDYARTKSKSAQDRVQRIEDKRNDLENKAIDARNKREETMATIATQERGQNVQMRNADLQYKAHMAQIGQMARPGETERLIAEYNSVLKNQGPEAAEKWMQVKERISGSNKAQATMGSLADKANDNIAAREKDNILLAQEYVRNPQKRQADVQAEFQRLQQAYTSGTTGLGGFSGAPVMSYVPGKGFVSPH